MKKLIISLSIILCYNLLAQAQYRSADNSERRHKNITLNFFGTHLIGGPNFDMRFQKGRLDGIGGSIGTGFAFLSASIINSNNSIYIEDFPIEVNYVLGKNHSSLVLGAGLIPIYYKFKYNIDTNWSIFGIDFNGLTGKYSNFSVPSGFAKIAYRYQPINQGFTFELAATPIYIYGIIIPSFGMNFGYGFN